MYKYIYIYINIILTKKHAQLINIVMDFLNILRLTKYFNLNDMFFEINEFLSDLVSTIMP